MKQEVLIRHCETIEDFEIAKTITHDYMIWLGMDLGFQNTDKEFAVFKEKPSDVTLFSYNSENIL